jgi:hypothetical protein
MRYVKGACMKCGAAVKLDLGTLTPAEGRAQLEAMTSFHCTGNHIELNGPLQYLLVDWDAVHEDETEQPTDEDWLAEKRARYEQVVDTKSLAEAIDRVVGFSMGACVVERNGREEVVEFERSPSGMRYYLVGTKAAVDESPALSP